MKFRAFLGLPLDDDSRRMLAQTAQLLQHRDKRGEVRWTDPLNYHVTLAFLDDIHVADADPLMTLVDAEVAGRPVFQSPLSHIGYFPANARPRLVLAHVEANEPLRSLHRAVSRAVRAARLPLEKRNFVPHVTLGRLRGRSSPWLEIPPLPLAGALPVEAVHLYRSDRDERGARYRVVHTAGLSGASR